MMAALKWVAFLCVVFVSCVRTSTVTCDDGRTCPSDYTCDEVHRGCAAPQQVDSCEGKTEQEPCSYPGVENGACFDGVCLPAGCGNSVLDEDEVCDDGNRFHGDGCSADCLSNETCGNGFVDVVKGEACDDKNNVDSDGCQANCASPTCGDGKVDSQYNEQCDKGGANSDAADAECRTNCQPGRCGDGIQDVGAGELCDDGDLYSGDGCSFDCKSNELCGNGYVDPVHGEQCDDGDVAGQDGCASQCLPERPQWRLVTQSRPDPRSGHAIVYDAAHGQTLLFGGETRLANYDWLVLGDTWTWDGAAWLAHPLDTRPPPRQGHAMAYDSVRRRVVMFGGEGQNNAKLRDTWEWNGAGWEQKFPTNIPPSANDIAMAFDPVLGKVVMIDDDPGGDVVEEGTWEWDGVDWKHVGSDATTHGGGAIAFDAARRKLLLVRGTTTEWNGSTYVTYDAGTWEWTGSTWTSLNASSSPTVNGVMAFDAARGVLVYRDEAGTTSSWNGSTWTQSNPAIAPSGRYYGVMAYDAARAQLVVFGGMNWTPPSGVQTLLDDTWTWNGAEWQKWAPPSTDPAAMTFTAMAFDQIRGRLVLFGGQEFSGAASGETWEWDGSTWTRKVTTNGPSPRSRHSMAFDAARGTIVLFGGDSPTGVLNDTWTWDGTTWRQGTPTTSPPARTNAAMAYDPVRGVVVLFSGRYSAPLTDTWEWDGTSWTAKNPATKPPGCSYGCQLAYDTSRSKMVLYEYSERETWEWDGTLWTKKLPTTIPPRREWGALAYDGARNRVVVQGGWYTTGTGPWEFNGTNWVDKTPPNDDRYRERHSMAYDAVRQTVVMFGGAIANYGYLNDTQEWNGTSWALRGPASPSPRQLRAMAYDSVRRKTVLFGGDYNGGSNVLTDTWEWDGARWQRMTTTVAPQGCYFGGTTMAFDVARRKTVLACEGQTWLWDGVAWEQKFPTTSPGEGPMTYDAERQVVVMVQYDTYEWDGTDWTQRDSSLNGDVVAYDARRKKTVLYGAGSSHAETWEWDGTTWVQKLPLVTPGRREGAGMVYDAARGTVILFGGASETADTWEWDGVMWRLLLPDLAPSGREWAGMSYDAARRETILFGGDQGGTDLRGDTWTFRFESARTEDVCLQAIDGDGDGKSGCADSDCAGYCDPSTCGNAVCSAYENCRICPADCGACTALCGDFACDAGETASSCPTDCP